MIKLRLVLFIVSFVFWLLLNWSIGPRYLISGGVLSILVSFLSSRMFYEKKTNVFKNPVRYLWFFYYLAVFIWECVKANVDGAYRVTHPNLPINPGIIKVKTKLKSDIGLTFLANSLTLKPGTMAVDIDKEKGFLYVHWVDVRTQDIDEATRLIVQKFERIIVRIFP